MTPCERLDEVERRAIEEFARRHDLSAEDAAREWLDAGPAIKAGCRAAARMALRAARPDRDQMVRSHEYTKRSE